MLRSSVKLIIFTRNEQRPRNKKTTFDSVNQHLLVWRFRQAGLHRTQKTNANEISIQNNDTREYKEERLRMDSWEKKTTLYRYLAQKKGSSSKSLSPSFRWESINKSRITRPIPFFPPFLLSQSHFKLPWLPFPVFPVYTYVWHFWLITRICLHATTECTTAEGQIIIPESTIFHPIQ